MKRCEKEDLLVAAQKGVSPRAQVDNENAGKYTLKCRKIGEGVETPPIQRRSSDYAHTDHLQRRFLPLKEH